MLSVKRLYGRDDSREGQVVKIPVGADGETTLAFAQICTSAPEWRAGEKVGQMSLAPLVLVRAYVAGRAERPVLAVDIAVDSGVCSGVDAR